jgi:hypothetical protein
MESGLVKGVFGGFWGYAPGAAQGSLRLFKAFRGRNDKSSFPAGLQSGDSGGATSKFETRLQITSKPVCEGPRAAGLRRGRLKQRRRVLECRTPDALDKGPFVY